MEKKICIPSKDEREYLESMGYELNDWQIACLIYNNYSEDIDKQLELLREFSEETTDETLSAQIYQRIEYEQRVMDKIRDNSSEHYVYVVNFSTYDWERESVKGVFTSYDNAFSFANSYNELYPIEDEYKRFEISKYDLIVNELPSSRSIDYHNPFYDGGSGTITEKNYFDGESVGSVVYENGKKWHSYSSEISLEDMNLIDQTGLCRFEELFLPLPQPFDKGDCVKLVDEEKIGIVESSKEEWDKLVKEYGSDNNSKTDGLNGEDTLKVVFLEGDGHFSHDHISPIYLERVDIDSISYNLNRDVLSYASGVIRGDGGLESFLMFYEHRRKMKQ